MYIDGRNSIADKRNADKRTRGRHRPQESEYQHTISVASTLRRFSRMNICQLQQENQCAWFDLLAYHVVAQVACAESNRSSV